jgi:hypothetical protein
MSLLLLLALPGRPADIDVQARGGRFTVKARAAPLVDVLERLSRETGLEVVFDGRRPTERVTVEIDQLPEAEALTRLFEGTGVDYAFQTDPTGRRVKMLVVCGSSGSDATAARRPAPARGTVAPPPEWAEGDKPFATEEAEEGEEPAEPLDTLPTGIQPFVPGSPGGPAPHPGGSAPGFGPGSAPPGVSPDPPTFPGEASSPLPAPVFPTTPSTPVAPPAFPREASSPD